MNAATPPPNNETEDADDEAPDNSLRAWLWLIVTASLLAIPLILNWISAP